MRLHAQQEDGVLTLRVEGRSLVAKPDWTAVSAASSDTPPVVALDLQGAEFVSSLFLEACVGFSRELAAQGRQFVLLNPSQEHRRLLEIVDGAQRIPVACNQEYLRKHLRTLRPGQASSDGDDGVTRSEKTMLWG